MASGYPLEDLARRVGGRVHGDPALQIRGIATLDRAGPHDLSFLTNVKYRRAAAASGAGALLVAPDSGLESHVRIEVADPHLALVELLRLFHPARRAPAEISPDARIGCDVKIGREVSIGAFAVIGDRVVLGDRTVIGPGCALGEDCEIGEESELRPNVVLYPRTSIGKRCLIHSGVVLGGDGFGFATADGEHHKVPQVGRLVVGDDVEVGANATADRGALDDTRIDDGTKVDNLVMIAHGARVGARSLLAAQSGIAGSTRLGERTTLAGQSGVAGHLDIAPGTVVAAKSAVFNDIKPGAFVAGVPAIDHRVWKRSQLLVRKLPELQKEIRDLRRRLQELERAMAGNDSRGEES